MYYCYWTNCDIYVGENTNSMKNYVKFEKLSECLEYVDTIKYVTCGDNGHLDTNQEGAHYIEVGSDDKVFLRLYHHWDDPCSEHGGLPESYYSN